MSTSISCPNCKKQYKLKPELAGRRVKCAGCGESFTVTLPSAGLRAGTPADKAAASPRSASPAKPKSAAPAPPRKPAAARQAQADPDDWMNDPSIAGLESQHRDEQYEPVTSVAPSQASRSPSKVDLKWILIGSGALVLVLVVSITVILLMSGHNPAGSSADATPKVTPKSAVLSESQISTAASQIKKGVLLKSMIDEYGQGRIGILLIDQAGPLSLPANASRLQALNDLIPKIGAVAGAKELGVVQSGQKIFVTYAPVDDVNRMADAVTFGEVKIDLDQRAVTVVPDMDKLASPSLTVGQTPPTGLDHGKVLVRYDQRHCVILRIKGMNGVQIISPEDRTRALSPWLDRVRESSGAHFWGITQIGDDAFVTFASVDLNKFVDVIKQQVSVSNAPDVGANLFVRINVEPSFLTR